MIRVGRFVIPALLVTATTLPTLAQLSFVYVESFRKGSSRVMEQTIQVDLDPKNPTCAIRARDQNGRARYMLRCEPERVGPEDDRIIAWQVKLADLNHKIYGNVLMPTPDPTEDRTQIGWLDPGKFAKIALKTERVVKVDHFYVVFRVTDSHFVAPGQPYLDQMTVDIHFTNTMPHSEVRGWEEKAPS
jgi:hypothetical protein